MNKTQAVKTLNYYGKERNQANTNSMDWMPNQKSWKEIREATATLNGEWPASLTVAGRELYQHMFDSN